VSSGVFDDPVCMWMAFVYAFTEFSNALDAGIYVVIVLVSMKTDTLFQNSMQLGHEYDTVFPVPDKDWYPPRDQYTRFCDMRISRGCCCVCCVVYRCVHCRSYEHTCQWVESIFCFDCCY
jgi:hypothetical protein